MDSYNITRYRYYNMLYTQSTDIRNINRCRTLLHEYSVKNVCDICRGSYKVHYIDEYEKYICIYCDLQYNS